MIKKITNIDSCFGCTACANVCPRNAITMERNEKGFIYPIIHSGCVECGKCINVCPANSPAINKRFIEVKAMQNKNTRILKNSSSGGVFFSIAKYIIENSGVVYGVAYSSDFHAKHIRVTSIDELYQLQGSKYVQSELNSTFSLIEKDLKNGLLVLFTGTSCQCDALVHYLDSKKINQKNIFTVALLCHGVPSPKLFINHIHHIQKTRRKRIIEYKNREKVHGWHEHNECIHFEDGTKEWRTKLSQNYKDLFYLNVILRESCYSCPYAKSPCASDLVIGDYWGMEYFMKDKDNNLGTSIVFIISDKGKSIIDHVNKSFITYIVDEKTCLKYNHHSPCKRPNITDEFWRDYKKNGYEYIIKKYANYNVCGRIIWRLKKELRRILVKLRILPA